MGRVSRSRLADAELNLLDDEESLDRTWPPRRNVRSGMGIADLLPVREVGGGVLVTARRFPGRSVREAAAQQFRRRTVARQQWRRLMDATLVRAPRRSLSSRA
jgi:hypothetical protein